jgi:mono/diheme cytochrome c family protein
VRRSAVVLAVALAAAGLTACQDHEFHPPPAEERVSSADSMYSPALFDSVTWESPEARVEAGNLVFADECRRCHGAVGRGDTEYAEGQELDVPSLVEADWELAGDLEEVRRRVFIGHITGMPSWGLNRLEPRQIDAAAFYIMEQLRPEILADSATAPPGP